MFEDLDDKKTIYQSLEELPGIGPATVNKLREIGFKTIESLSTATIAELVSAGIGEAIARKVIDAARNSRAITFVRGDELVELRILVSQLGHLFKGEPPFLRHLPEYCAR